MLFTCSWIYLLCTWALLDCSSPVQMTPGCPMSLILLKTI
uniref:Uncharacterized protein n=1 Tax=Arundo donax TaxID=35708 RepID=A0A0A9AGR8_ARUDO